MESFIIASKSAQLLHYAALLVERLAIKKHFREIS